MEKRKRSPKPRLEPKRKSKPKSAKIYVPDFNAPSPLVRERLTKVCVPFIRECSVAIGIVKNGVPEHHCSGTLLAIADAHFVLTCSHALEGYDFSNLLLYIHMSNGKHVFLNWLQFVHTGDSKDHYGFDIAAIKLNPEQVATLQNGGKKFIDQRYLRPDDGLGVCIFYGFPLESCKNRVVPKALCLLGPRDPGHSASWHQKYHLLMGSDPQLMDVWTENKEPIPHLSGISGCGIWRVCNLDCSEQPYDVLKLVGIEHHAGDGHQSRSSHIKATQIQYLINLLAKHDPSLIPAMNLIFKNPNYC